MSAIPPSNFFSMPKAPSSGPREQSGDEEDAEKEVKRTASTSEVDPEDFKLFQSKVAFMYDFFVHNALEWACYNCTW